MSIVTRYEFDNLAGLVKNMTSFLGEMMKDNDRRFDAAKDIMQQLEGKIDIISGEGFQAIQEAVSLLEQKVTIQSQKIDMLYAMITGIQTMVDIVKDLAVVDKSSTT
jgi:hypothetical protein